MTPADKTDAVRHHDPSVRGFSSDNYAGIHLEILEAANLVSTVKRGREKLHFINPVPLHEVYERWVRKFERGRLSLLHDLKRELEGE